MLLDPFEEELDFPTISVEVGNRLRWYREIVCQEVEGLASV